MHQVHLIYICKEDTGGRRTRLIQMTWLPPPPLAAPTLEIPHCSTPWVNFPSSSSMPTSVAAPKSDKPGYAGKRKQNSCRYSPAGHNRTSRGIPEDTCHARQPESELWKAARWVEKKSFRQSCPPTSPSVSRLGCVRTHTLMISLVFKEKVQISAH